MPEPNPVAAPAAAEVAAPSQPLNFEEAADQFVADEAARRASETAAEPAAAVTAPVAQATPTTPEAPAAPAAPQGVADMLKAGQLTEAQVLEAVQFQRDFKSDQFKAEVDQRIQTVAEARLADYVAQNEDALAQEWLKKNFGTAEGLQKLRDSVERMEQGLHGDDATPAERAMRIELEKTRRELASFKGEVGKKLETTETISTQARITQEWKGLAVEPEVQKYQAPLAKRLNAIATSNPKAFDPPGALKATVKAILQEYADVATSAGARAEAPAAPGGRKPQQQGAIAGAPVAKPAGNGKTGDAMDEFVDGFMEFAAQNRPAQATH